MPAGMSFPTISKVKVFCSASAIDLFKAESMAHREARIWKLQGIVCNVCAQIS